MFLRMGWGGESFNIVWDYVPKLYRLLAHLGQEERFDMVDPGVASPIRSPLALVDVRRMGGPTSEGL